MALNMSISGTYRLVHRDANDNTIAELLEKHTQELGGSGSATTATDPQMMAKVKKHLSTVMREDDKLVIMLKPDTTRATGTTAEVRTYRIPVTFRNRRSGIVYEKTLIYGDMTHEIAVATNNAWTSGRWYDVDSYTVPAQSEMKLGHSVQDVRVDSSLNLHDAIEV